MDSNGLNRELSQNVITPLYLFLAYDPFIARSYYHLMKRKAVDADFRELNVNEYDKKANPSDVIATCMTLPIMAEKRIVFVRDTSFSKCSDLCAALVRYAKKPCETTILILFANEIDKRSSLYKTFSQYGKVVECEKMKSPDLTKWIRMAFQRKQLKITEEAVRFFIDSSDYLSKESEIDLGYFANEIEKLTLSNPIGNEITLDHIKKTLSVNINEDVFRLSDDLLNGDTADAYVQTARLQFYNVPFQQILAVVAKAIRTFLICRTLHENGVGNATIAKEYGLHPYTVKKSIAFSERFSASDAKKSILILNRLDVGIKTGELDPDTAIALMVHQIGGRNFLLSERDAI
ncbi:MAG: DNA polymerase III subunit delta [Anaerofustis sp.]